MTSPDLDALWREYDDVAIWGPGTAFGVAHARQAMRERIERAAAAERERVIREVLNHVRATLLTVAILDTPATRGTAAIAKRALEELDAAVSGEGEGQ